MRVIAGSARGHGLKAPKHLGLRPTPTRVKQAVFSSLGNRVEGIRMLELFAGTGAFSIEMLSRGARHATLIEKDHRAVALIRANLKKTHVEDQATVHQADVRQAVEWLSNQPEPFDLIFADPPYLKVQPHASKDPAPGRVSTFSWMNWMLKHESLPSLLSPDGILLIEYFKKEPVPESITFEFQRDFRFGDTIVGLFAKRKKNG